MMTIAEPVFYTIQGEGLYSGVPSLFVRFTGCSLRCGFCDTVFAWKSKWMNITPKAILDKIDRLGKRRTKHVVITGGEPYLQKELPDLVNLLQDNGYFVTIETNGLQFNEEVKPDLISISPKLKNSIPKDAFKYVHAKKIKRLENIPKLIKNAKDYQFKFVVTKEREFAEIEEILKKVRKEVSIDNQKVYIMPEGVKRRNLYNKSLKLIWKCLEKGYSLTPRIHIIIGVK